MKSRKDQVQAYFFVVGRLAAAVTHGKPDVLESPSKRMTTGTVLGFVLAAVIAGVFGIFGMFVPPTGNSSWRQEGAIVMNKVSGARYVYLGGQLRPVFNFASARLVSGSSEVTSVAPAALAGATVGQPIGIPDAPDSLPPADKNGAGSWTVCMQAAASPGGKPAEVSLLLDGPGGAAPGEEKAFLVSVPGGSTFLVTDGKRFRVPSRSAIAALGYGGVSPVDVAPVWLNTIPQGTDLSAPPVPGTGENGPLIEGRQSLVGQLYQVRNSALGTDQMYLVRRDGLAAISRTGAALLLAAASTGQAYPAGAPVEPIRVGPTALAGVPITGASGLANDLPAVPPEVVTPPPGSQPCVRHSTTAAGELIVATEVLSGDDVTRASVPLGTHQTGNTADRIGIPAGGGFLARDLPASGAVPTGVIYLITEVGKKYPLADPEAIKALGYTESAAKPVRKQLLDLLPTGPTLSVGAARETQAVQP
ncbi:type VII secretion protein EccB [Amycolatopsis speibonae]|uniref:Type VII secretion protein EccB n=1 Tax=Amycolatopsis speibonae TaxID=1450224 RepID=A0ABV7P2B2_9PSEU